MLLNMCTDDLLSVYVNFVFLQKVHKTEFFLYIIYKQDFTQKLAALTI